MYRSRLTFWEEVREAGKALLGALFAIVVMFIFALLVVGIETFIKGF